jgi:hypothetical protein
LGADVGLEGIDIRRYRGAVAFDSQDIVVRGSATISEFGPDPAIIISQIGGIVSGTIEYVTVINFGGAGYNARVIPIIIE